MCRIDTLFDVTSLDEKKDPIERFIQALDENDIEGGVRTLLITHFSENWQSMFSAVTDLEEALDNTKQYESEGGKCTSFLLYKKIKLEHHYLCYLKGTPAPDNALFNFLDDVKQTYFHDSPFCFYTNGMNEVVDNYYLFVSWLYGSEYCFSKDFFDDKSLNVLVGSERTAFFWRFFYNVAPQFQILSESRLLKELTSIATSEFTLWAHTKDSSRILCGLEFMKSWIKFDSNAGRLSYNWHDFSLDYDSPFRSLVELLYNEKFDCKETSKLLRKWLDITKLECEKLLYLSADLKQLSVEDSEQWVSGFNSFFTSYINTYIYSDYGYNQLTDDSLSERLGIAHNEFCSELNPLQISTWIKYSIKDDFQRVLNSNPTPLHSSMKWCQKTYATVWKKAFLKSLNELAIENQLRILSSSVPYSRGYSVAFYSEFSNWWNELFRNLVEQDDFPKKLTPDWTVIAVDRFNREDVFPYIDKSIGVLRGELTKTENTEDLEIYHQKLEKLFGGMDKSSPRKALRHRLLLMRSSKQPFSDESISKLGGLSERKNFQKWYDSLKHLAGIHVAYQVNDIKTVTAEHHSQVQNDFYIAFSHELAEFCLDRLRLRKGEKAIDNKYTANQIIEQSAIWRQGYLKALIELGFDLNGKVHKTVNFTKKSDPDASVRAIASECYKEVRRNAKKSPSIQDIKRSIVAAEWWLLISQRRELDLVIKHEEALKTRRNLMRNP